MDARGCVCWHELLAANSDDALNFYAGLFGWQKGDAESGEFGTYQMFSASGQTIGGIITKPPMISAPFWLYYFHIGDLDMAIHRVKAAGGQILNGPIELPVGAWIVQCADPQGAVFALEGKVGKKVIGYFNDDAVEDGRGNSCARWREVRTLGTAWVSDFKARPRANWPTGPSMWNSIPVILANRSILVMPIAHPPSSISVAIK